jgi:hypothetical protein
MSKTLMQADCMFEFFWLHVLCNEMNSNQGATNMSYINTVQLKDAPEVKAIIEKASGKYSKRKAYISVFPEHGIQFNSYWDGGSKSYYTVIELATMRVKDTPMTSTHPYFDVARQGFVNMETADVAVDSKGNLTLKRLPEGFALVETGIFCGKTATAHVYLNPANMAKYLTAGQQL